MKYFRLAAASLLAGLCAGFVGLFCISLHHLIDQFLYPGSGDFLLRVRALKPIQLLLYPLLATVIGAFSWFGLYRYVRRERLIFPSVSASIAISSRQPELCGAQSATTTLTGRFDGLPRLSLLATIWHALTQIVVVAIGGAIGREVAPREISAHLTQLLAKRSKIEVEAQRALVGSAAASALAAVYCLPITGIVYALEGYRVKFTPRYLLSSAVVSLLAVSVAWGGLTRDPLYALPGTGFSVFASFSSGAEAGVIHLLVLIIVATVAGIILGIVGGALKWVLDLAARKREKSAWILLTLPAAGLAIGAIAMFEPTVLGNGYASAQAAFHARPGLLLSVLLLVIARLLVTVLMLRGGAYGGILTPSLAMGAGVGAFIALVGGAFLPAESLPLLMLSGGAVVLGITMRAPLTGMVLALEFTGAAWIYAPFVALASCSGIWIQRKIFQR